MAYRTRRRADSVQVGDMIHTMRGWQRVQARRDRPGTGPVLRPMVSIEVEAPLGSASYTLTGLAEATGLMTLGANATRVPAGSTVDVLLLDRHRCTP